MPITTAKMKNHSSGSSSMTWQMQMMTTVVSNLAVDGRLLVGAVVTNLSPGNSVAYEIKKYI